jgi:hypothetical protein
LEPHDLEFYSALGGMNVVDYESTLQDSTLKAWAPGLKYPSDFTAVNFSPKTGAIVYMSDHNQIFWDSKLVRAIYEAVLADLLKN